jgi:hypothetical protein
LGGASAWRRFFAGRGDNVIPANISDISGLVCVRVSQDRQPLGAALTRLGDGVRE